MPRRLLYLGGNGHCAARLDPARRALDRLAAAGEITPFELHDVPYPGFEGRLRAADLTAFLDSISSASAGGAALVYATGIGGLLALCLRARGEWVELPLLLQAPVLWGLERRWMPWVLRFAPARRLLGCVFARGVFQRRFARRQFERPPDAATRDAFFAGYARCTALPDLFAWLTPALLRQLDTEFIARPEALQHITVWWGGRDRVVGPQELAWTEQELDVRWPLRVFPAWGHYPMLDDPDDWVRNLADAVATADRVPGPVGPQAR